MDEIAALHTWFEKNKRDFPWRKERTAYRVWVSEVMLQQTRATVVIPYFLRWIKLFPDVRALAKTPLEQVIKAWEGLGYYSRARNLHAAAKEIVEKFGGKMSPEMLDSVRGIGPYTRGAILGFGFQKRAPAVDGNVRRVISRLCLIEENIEKTRVQKEIEKQTEALLDEKEPWVTSEAFIELGAMVCQPKPLCENCPLQKKCLAFQAGRAENLPVKSRDVQVTLLHRIVTILLWEKQVLVKKGEQGKVMADLYEFPYFEKETFLGKKVFGLEVEWQKNLSSVSHTFTRFKAHLYPKIFRVKKGKKILGFEWMPIKKLSTLPFSSGHRKIAQEFFV